jgi:hypothetical protein
MLREALRPQSQCGLVSGNVVNHAGLSPVHQYIGAAAFPHSASYNGSVERDGIPNNFGATGSFVYPMEWSHIHWSFLNHVVRGTARQAYSFDPAKAPFDTFSFQCDGAPRRWGLNLVAFTNFTQADHSRMLQLQQNGIGNVDEVYLTAARTKHLRQLPGHAEFHTCAVGAALGVHYMYAYQLKHLRVWKRVRRGLARDPKFIHPYVLSLYDHLALAVGGERPCCEDNGCPLYSMDRDDFMRYAVPFDAMRLRMEEYRVRGEPTTKVKGRRRRKSG